MSELWAPMFVENAVNAVMGPMDAQVEVKLSWAKGQIGAIPVFSNKEDAEAYREGVPAMCIGTGEVKG